jgi:hypothetical protein
MDCQSENGKLTATVKAAEPNVALTMPLSYVKALAAVFGGGMEDTLRGYVRNHDFSGASAYLDALTNADPGWHYAIFDVCDEVMGATGSSF